MHLENLDLIIRLLIAAGLGSLIGFERERLSWAAGLRTHMLVCVGSCLFMIVSAYGFSDLYGKNGITLDPSRIAGQVVSGIGFLGAGSILLRGEVVRGLTTAASLWTVAALGLAVGGGMYVEACAATAVVLVILAGIKPIEEHYHRTKPFFELAVEADHAAISFDTLKAALGERSSRIRQLIVRQSKNAPDTDDVTICLTRLSAKDVKFIAEHLETLPGVRSVRQRPANGRE